MQNQRLDQATELIKSGKTEEAREVLELMIREDRGNIAAWRLYAEAWPTAKDKIRVWELCLRHNPQSREAADALALLMPGRTGKPQSPTQPTSVTSSRSSSWLLWVSIVLFLGVAALAVLALRTSAPKNPEKYRHVQPVEYYLYVPEAYTADQEWPMFVGIHGAGGTGLDCWNLWQSYAEQEGYVLLCPSIPGDASGFYQDVGENTVWSAIGEVRKDYRVRQQMFLSGFSAGAFFVQGFTYHYPQYVNGLSILSAGVYLNPRMFINLVPMVVVIGGSDNPDAVQSSQVFVTNLQKFGFNVQYAVLPNVGHTVTKDGIDMTLALFRKTIGN
jgi:hypothetical protein